MTEPKTDGTRKVQQLVSFVCDKCGNQTKNFKRKYKPRLCDQCDGCRSKEELNEITKR